MEKSPDAGSISREVLEAIAGEVHPQVTEVTALVTNTKVPTAYEAKVPPFLSGDFGGTG